MYRRQRHIDGVDLIVAYRTGRRPAGTGDDADHLEGLIPDRHLDADRVDPGAEELLDDDAAENDNLRPAGQVPGGEEATLRKRPRPTDVRERRLGTMEPRKPPLAAENHARGLVDGRRHVLNPTHLAADGVGIVSGERCGGAKAGGRIAQPLTCGRVIVFLHRVVFRMTNWSDDRTILNAEDGAFEPEHIGVNRVRLVIGHATPAVVALHAVVARGDRDDVHAGRGHLVCDRRPCTVPNRHHRQHCADTDGDAE